MLKPQLIHEMAKLLNISSESSSLLIEKFLLKDPSKGENIGLEDLRLLAADFLSDVILEQVDLNNQLK